MYIVWESGMKYGVFSSAERAKEFIKGRIEIDRKIGRCSWFFEVYYSEVNSGEIKSIGYVNSAKHPNLVVDEAPKPADPVIQLAYDILEGDPMARDAAQDILTNRR